MVRFMGMLNNISRSQAVFRQSRIAAEGLSPGQYAFVWEVCREPGRSQEELARSLCLNKSTVARSLTALEARGYVKREPHPTDKRRLLVYPTDRMLPLFPELKAVSAEWSARLSEGIPEEELALFHSVLARMLVRAREIIEEETEK